MSSAARIYTDGSECTTASGYIYDIQPLDGAVIVVTDKLTGIVLKQVDSTFLARGPAVVLNGGRCLCTKVFSRALAASGGGGGTPFDPAVLQRKVAILAAGEHSFSAADNRNIYRVSADGTEVFTPLLAAPPSGASYEVVFEFTPLTETVNFDFGGWQWVDQSPKPTAWVVGKTYCFTVVYMDGVTAPIVALSYTRNAQ